MDFKDYYKVLQIEPDADDKAIKTAYRKLARKYHPDVSKEADAENQFKEVSEAYEVLKSPEKRSEYDELRKYGGRQGQPFQAPPGWQPRGGGRNSGAGAEFFDEEGGDFSDFFANIFGSSGRGNGFQGRGGNAARRGQDVEMELPITLEETLSDEPKAVSFQVSNQAAKTLNVKIPVGVVDGERIRLKGQGGLGVGAANGDLYLVIKLMAHPLFDVEGQDLIITVALAPWEAALGAKIAVPTLTGRINMTIPANSQAGQRLRVKGKGLRNKQGGQGDLYAQLKVVMPKAGTEATEQLWRELADKAAFDPRSEWSQ